MRKIEWDKAGEHFYETGVKNGVLYLQNAQGKYPKGVAWNGLSAVSENPSGAEATPIYADNTKYLNLYSTEEFGATIEAYVYPEEFEQCDGSAALDAGIKGISIGQQNRASFGFCYRSELGNDILGDAYGYKLHLIYGCKASPSEKSYATINDSPEAITFSWEVTTIPVNVRGMKPTSTLIIDSTKLAPEKLAKIEDALYGIDADEFDSTKTYAVGDKVWHTDAEDDEAKAYKCTTAVEVAGEWDEDDWTLIEDADAHLPLPDEILTLISD